MKIEIIQANYLNAAHARDIVYLLNLYANDPMGGGQPLKQTTQSTVVNELAKRPYAFSILAYVNGNPAGLVNCFEAFSTFNCKPLVNIHDVIVSNAYRGNGISQKMLAEVENIAKTKGCCKLTLEVLEGNDIARSSYTRFGFSGYELDPKMGKALFWEKSLHKT